MASRAREECCLTIMSLDNVLNLEARSEQQVVFKTKFNLPANYLNQTINNCLSCYRGMHGHWGSLHYVSTILAVLRGFLRREVGKRKKEGKIVEGKTLLKMRWVVEGW